MRGDQAAEATELDLTAADPNGERPAPDIGPEQEGLFDSADKKSY